MSQADMGLQVNMLQPEEESSILEHLVEEIHCLTATFPTTVADDHAILSNLTSTQSRLSLREASGTYSSYNSTPESSLPQPLDDIAGTANLPEHRRIWEVREHAMMAVHYRLQRKLLLRQVQYSLESQIQLVTSKSGA